MGLLDRFRQGSSNGTTTLDTVLSQNDLIQAEKDYIIVSKKEENTKKLADRQTQSQPPLDSQISGSGTTVYGQALREEYLPELRGEQGILTYREMRNDSQVRASLRVAKSPVLAARWFMEPASQEASDVEIANFIWDNLTKWMSTSWPQLLVETMYMLDYGYYVFEKVFTRGQDGSVIWKKFSPIHPLEIVEPIFDPQGGYAGLKILVDGDEVDISIDRLLIFTFDKEAGDLEGKSLLRSAYKHWFFKENLIKIDAIQKERHGIGVPVIKLPENYTVEKDVPAAHAIGRNLRTNENAHIVLPPRWEIEFAELRGQNVNVLDSIQYHGDMIYENVLASYIKHAATSPRGTQDNDAHFLKSTRFIADIIRDVWNKYAIPQLVWWNWGPDTPLPKLKARRLGDTIDWRTISFAMRNFAGMGALIPDDELEHWIRNELDLPQRDEATSREVSAPQLPRQAQTVNQRNNAGSGNTGADRSGG